jgi:putative addiction module antidote
MISLKLTQIGNSVGVILPKEVLARLKVGKGDTLFVTEAAHGGMLTPYEALGDAQLEAGRVLLAGQDRELSAWLGVELPTGSEAKLTGNGATDVAAWLAGRVALGGRFELSGQAGAAAPGGDAPLPWEDVVGFGTLALGWHATTGFTGLAPTGPRGGIARDSGLRFLDSAVLLTLGGRLRFIEGYELEAGVTEDIAVDRSPDVSFYIGLRWPFLH